MLSADWHQNELEGVPGRFWSFFSSVMFSLAAAPRQSRTLGDQPITEHAAVSSINKPLFKVQGKCKKGVSFLKNLSK